MSRATSLFWLAVLALLAYIVLCCGCIEPHYHFHFEIVLPDRTPADATTTALENSLEILTNG